MKEASTGTRRALLALVAMLLAAGAETRAPAESWTIEVLSSESPALLDPTARELGGTIVFEASSYRLQVGRFETREDAEARLRTLRVRFAGAHVRRVQPAETSQETRIERRAMPGHTPRIEIYPGVDDWPPLSDPPGPERFAPDEREAWALLHAGRPRAALEMIAGWRRRAPGWTPSEPLLEQARRSAWELDFEHAAAGEDWDALVTLAEARPGATGCSAPERAWTLARARVARDEGGAARELFASMIRECDADIAVATLQKTPGLLGEDAFLELVAGGRDLAGDARVADLVFGVRAARLARAVDAGDDALFLSEEALLLPSIRSRQDATLASMAGWHHLGEGRASVAARRFESALAWSGEDESAYGLALALRASRRDEEALAVAEPRARASGRFAVLARDILTHRARASSDPAERVALLRRAEDLGEPSVGERRALGWALLEAGKPGEAAALFEEIHEISADESSAEGLAAALVASGRRDELRRRARAQGGPFESSARSLDAIDEMHAGRALRAQELAPGVDAALVGVDAPSLGGLAGFRRKKGREGLDELEILKLPVLVAREVRRGAHRIDLDLEVLSLETGRASRGALLGSAPEGEETWSKKPLDALSSEMVGRIAWTREGPSAPDVALGVTPGGPAGRSVTLEAGWTFSARESGWRAGLHHLPLRESMLSFVGQIDPFSGRVWGGVMRSGATLTGWKRLGRRWGLAGNAGWESLDGKGVESNSRLSVYASASYDLRLPAFSYLSVGPFALYEGFDRNLSGFTLGHGGYFSPSSLVDGGVAVDFMTREARAFVVKGRASLAYDTHRVDEAPLLPGKDDPRVYAGARESGLAYALEFLAVWQPPGRRWQVGGGFSLRKTGGFEDGTFVLVLRRSGSARGAAFRMDLPEAALSRLR